MAEHYPIGFYVYQLADPRTGVPFYAGKGQRRRAWEHERHVRSGRGGVNREKVRIIQEIIDAGLRVEVQIVAAYDHELEALDHEFRLIDASPHLTNIVPGGNGEGLSQREADRRAAARVVKLRKVRERARQMAAHADHVRRREMLLARATNERERQEILAWLNSVGEDAKRLLAPQQVAVERKETAEALNRQKLQKPPTRPNRRRARFSSKVREINPADYVIHDGAHW